MDPATLALLQTYGIPLLCALAGIVLKHFLPGLGSSVLPVPASPVTPAATGHPLIDQLLNLLRGATAQTAPGLAAAVPAVVAAHQQAAAAKTPGN